MQENHRRRLGALAAISAALIGTALAAPPAATAAPSAARHGKTVLVTAGLRGELANGDSYGQSVTPNGRYVVFTSVADNLVRNATNGQHNIFVRDLRTGITRLASVGYHGVPADGGNFEPSISAHGRYVAFESFAGNLMKSATATSPNVFVRDLVKHVTIQVSVGLSGEATSGGGLSPSISGDGSKVAFVSYATDIVAGDTNNAGDIFVWNRRTRKTIRVSVGPGGVQSDPTVTGQEPFGSRSSSDPKFSANGNVVAFTSFATNLVAGDTNGGSDVFVRNLKKKTTTRVSVATGGGQAFGGYKEFGSRGAKISGDGDVIIFDSFANGLVPTTRNHMDDVYVHFVRANRTELLETTDDGALSVQGVNGAAVSVDGRYLAFSTADTNVVPGDANGKSDVFLRDLRKGTTRLVVLAADGSQTDGDNGSPSISSRGKVVVFASTADNLLPGLSGGASALFAHRI